MADARLHYDRIGIDYAQLRKPDPRIAAHIERALGTAQSILNVGAGTGSYEPAGREVTALEPSQEMISQRPTNAGPAIQGFAEDLPFPDNSFDAAMAVLTVHHWTDQARGMAEMRRVSRGPVVIFTFDPAFRDNWLLDYFPEFGSLDDGQMPAIWSYTDWLGPVEVSAVPIPHDCGDGFGFAYWRRPRAYLDPRIRKGMSSFWAIKRADEGLAKLERDLDSGEWERRYSGLLGMEELDLGYRLVVGT